MGRRARQICHSPAATFHGALIDGSAWRGVYDVLAHDGYHVSIVQQPLTGLDEDVAATQRVLDQQTGPIVLVGHSYGGAIITVAGADPRVKALVYVAALVPDAGETAGQPAPPKPEQLADFLATPDGVTLRPEKFAVDFGADLHSLDPEAAARMAQRAGSTVTRIKASHAVLISQPRAVARVIKTAARAVP